MARELGWTLPCGSRQGTSPCRVGRPGVIAALGGGEPDVPLGLGSATSTSFWSITLYDADRFLYANDLDRYSVSSRDLPTMLHDDAGGITVQIAHRLDDRALLRNWLPCPDGPFKLAFRTYLPRAEIRDGRWTAPPVRMQDEPR